MAQHPGSQPPPGQHDRRLIPQFILEQFALGEFSGRFPAAGIFFDLSGFTHLTESLMSHGPYGAEVLASVVETVFAPLVDTVFAQGGFVTSFHGDAFTALFPAEIGGEPDAARLALASAWRMRERLAGLATQETPFGEFRLAAKIGVAIGEAEWGILASESGERAVYNFKGTAVIHCAHAENQAAKDDIILTPAMLQVVGEQVMVESLGDHLRLTGITTPLPTPSLPDIPPPSRQSLGSFLPAAILDLPLRGEFRQIISLFINLEGTPHNIELLGFTELCFALQRQYGGFFHRITFDDKGCNLQLFWGAPISHEKDIARALNFILDLRRRYRTAIRAGMTYRMAFAGFVGSPLYEEYTCYSRGVNLAARLMSGAEWGEIYLSREVAEQAAEQYRTEHLGEREFKGIAAPQAVFRLLGRGGDGRPAFYRGRLVGREPELQELEQAVSPLFDGRFAGITAIVGEAGSGKSRLAHEFLAGMESSERCRVLRCQTDDILRQPLNPFRYALRGYFDQSPQDPVDTNRGRFERVLTELINATVDPNLRVELDRTRSFLGSLVDLRWPDSLYEQVEPQLRAENTFEALKTLFKAESLRRPLILLLEDVHVLDLSSQEFLANLTRHIDTYPIALLATSRQDLDPNLFDPGTLQRVIRLKALPEIAVEGMIEAMIGERPSPALVHQFAAKTAGNPLFVEQLLLYLQNNELLDTYAQSPSTPGQSNVHLPADVRSLLVAQIDQLPPTLRQASQIASVLGREFDVTVLSSMLLKPEGLDTTLALGIDHGVWYPLEGERYLFHHALLRDAAYDMQLTTRRRDLHSLAADTLLAKIVDGSPTIARLAEIAYHYDQANMAEAAGLYYGQAGELAAADYFNDQALAYFSRAIKLAAPSNLESRYHLLLGREAIYGLIGRRDEQSTDLQALESLLDQQPQADRQADVLLRRAAYSLALGDYAEAMTLAEESAALAENSGNSPVELRAYHRIGRAMWQQGRPKEAEQYLEKALALAKEIQSQIDEANCLYDLGNALQYSGAHTSARQNAMLAETIYQFLHDKQGEIRCANLIGLVDYSLGEHTSAHEQYEQALSLSKEVGWRFAEAALLVNLGNYEFEFGQYDRAREYLIQARDLSRGLGNRENEANSLDTLGLTAHYSGDTAMARDFFEQALTISRRIENQRSIGYILTHLGATMLDQDQPEEAIAILDEALAIRKVQGNEALVIDTLAFRALAADAIQDYDFAADLAEEVLNWARLNGSDSLELSGQVYLICYIVLNNAAQGNDQRLLVALEALQTGQALVEQRASLIRDAVLRQQFLNNVPFNRLLLANRSPLGVRTR